MPGIEKLQELLSRMRNISFHKITISIKVMVLCLCFVPELEAQEVYYPTTNSSVYEFLDELANDQIITLNSAVKPYSRILIARKLQEASRQGDKLNKRQRSQVQFFLRDFNKELHEDKNFKKRFDVLYYKDSLFRITLNPIVGVQYWNNASGSIFHRWNGAETYGSVGKNFGFYASLRDNYESKVISDNRFFTQRTGAVYKLDTDGGGEYSEIRGGLTYAWKWGSIGLVKDHFVWGNNYNGANIYSGRTPSFPQIRLNIKPVKWLELNYVHGWLVSDVVDSAASFVNGQVPRTVFRDKYVATNLISVTPIKGLIFSAGNSIVYSDIGINPVYLIPIFFYKSADHTLNSTSNFTGQNSQLFMDVSTRLIPHVHLFATWFVDELAIARITNSETQTNYWSVKLGGAVNNWPIQNTFVTLEYTRTNPGAFEHFLASTTFESNSFNLGHYLGQNSQEIYFSIAAKPIPRLKIQLAHTEALIGEDFQLTGLAVDAFGLPFLESSRWRSYSSSIEARYEVFNDISVRAMFERRTVSGRDTRANTAEFWRGNTSTFSFGINWGF